MVLFLALTPVVFAGGSTEEAATVPVEI